ncbi:MAG: DNRLRE domain-containing protein [Chloroflexaceae bacterium]|jgi:hypothetical protein|nr:DNRLRE domain-containing protein [Chloroflexaceae bacterium]
MRRVIAVLLIVALLPTWHLAQAQNNNDNRIFLPLVIGGRATLPPTATPQPPSPPPPPSTAARRVNAPYLNVADITRDRFSSMAVFWFGRVERTNNYTDVRVAFNDTALVVYTATFDRRVWYDDSPARADLTAWDSVTLYLDTAGTNGTAPGSSSYRFEAQMGPGGDFRPANTPYQAAYRGNGSGWEAANVNFSTRPGWRGERINDDTDDRGWVMTFSIPYSSLGLSGRPADGTSWALGVSVHDRDDRAGTPIPPQNWPPTWNQNRPSSWGGLVFGLPGYTAPPSANPTTITVRHRLNGADVPDGMVGGGFTCGNGLDFWTQWGEKNYSRLEDSPGEERGDFNVQNQSDIADWPCFSKNYITFPLGALPPGRVVVSAKLVLHQFGNAQPRDATPSILQVLTVAEDWNEATLNWNNAPLAVENISQATVQPVRTTAPFPGIPYEWDVSRAVAQAYGAGQPLRLALYSADSDYHSGKYFVSSDTGDWNAQGRPTLVVTLGTRP